MPSPEYVERNQKAVWWAVTGKNKHGEDVVGSTGVEIEVRWDNSKGIVQDSQKNTIRFDASVVVGEDAADMAVGDILWQGAIDDLPGTGSPLPPTSDIHKVVKFDATPDLKGRETRREANLMRLHDTLPTSGS